MLNNRQKYIIDILNDNSGWLTGKELARILNVSDRTIRSDIETINNHFQCLLIISNRRFGYRLDEIQLLNYDIKPKYVIPQNSNERSVWLLHGLLFKEKEINLIEVQDRVFVSGFSIENDIKKVKEIIGEYPTLILKRNKNHITLLGSEDDKRKLYKSLLTEETQGNFLNLNNIAKFWKHFDFMVVVDLFNETCENYSYHIKEATFPMIMLHAGVAIDRIYNHNYIDKMESNDELKSTLEYQVSYDFFKKVSENIQIELVEDEIIRFCMLLQGRSANVFSKQSNAIDIEKLYISIIETLNVEFGIDFIDDNDLRLGMMSHLKSLVDRQLHDVLITNLYLKEIKRKYPFVFEMAVCAGRVINKCLKKQINENELAFIAIHLGAAYERVNNQNKYRVVLIVPHNKLLVQPFIEKLNLRFNDRMVVVETYKYFDKSKVVIDKPDLIISTMPLQHDLQIPTIQISLFLNGSDESSIFQTLNHLDKVRYHDEFVELLKKIMREDLFFFNKEFDNPREIISFMCDNLVQKGLAPNEYKDDVLKREDISSTSFIYGFAVPHSLIVSTNDSCISMMILKKPVIWGDFEIKFVILLGIRNTDNQLMRIFFDWLCNIVTDSKVFTKVLESSGYEELMKNLID